MRRWLLALTTVLAVGLSANQASAVPNRVRGTVTNMGTVNVPYNYAATHFGDSQWTFRLGSHLKLIGVHGRILHVLVQDTCAGSACRMLDLSLSGFHQLGFSTSQGIGTVTAECGYGGHLPMRRCLAGEDQ